MKSTFIKGVTISALCSIGLLAGCASSEISNETEETTVTETVADTIETTVSEETITSSEKVTLRLFIDGNTKGEYGEEKTLNANTDLPKHIIMYKVPAGKYRATNTTKGKYLTQITVYSDEFIISDEGWEAYKDATEAKVLGVGSSEEIIVPQGYHIEVSANSSVDLEKID